MDTYDPLVAPDASEWLALDEHERIALARDHHDKAGVELPNEELHAVVHAIVENQVALGDEIPARAALDRLMEQGLDRHEAVHAIGGVLSGFLFDLTGDGLTTDEGNEKYFRELERITAADWLDSMD